ncbi:MAG: hypothetical protein ING77_00430 [Rhodocyclaceae bacterium]|jgi:hypothetical protein|nr:hypothetical protein [Rhodocyclaceae bacterium]
MGRTGYAAGLAAQAVMAGKRLPASINAGGMHTESFKVFILRLTRLFLRIVSKKERAMTRGCCAARLRFHDLQCHANAQAALLHRNLPIVANLRRSA